MSRKFALASLIWFLLSCYGLFSEHYPDAAGLWSSLMHFFELRGIAIDKVGHFIIFYGQTILALLAFPQFNKKTLGLLLGLLLVWGGVSEALQFYWTATRSAEMSDFAADTLGIFLGLLFFLFAKRDPADAVTEV